MNRKIIGWYQILGGAIGLIILFIFISKLDFITLLQIIKSLPILIIGLAFFSSSCYLGYLLLDEKKVNGIKYSIIFQIIQVFHISVFGYTFKLHSGISLPVGLNFSQDFLFTFNLSLSQFNIGWLKSDTDLIIATVNLIPLIIIYFLEKEKVQQNLTTNS